MSDLFEHDCVECGDHYQTFHAYEEYKCPSCVTGGDTR